MSVTPCLYCGGRSVDVIFKGVRDRLRFAPGEWAFYQCESCRSAVIDPFPRSDQMAASYPPVYDFNTRSDSFFGRWIKKIEYELFFKRQYRRQARFVLRRMDLARAGVLRMLDVGCGYGLRLKEFTRLGIEVEGSDMNRAAVGHIQSALGLKATASDSMDLAKHYESESFDLLTSFYMIEHVSDVRGQLKVFNRLIKPGGSLALATLIIESQQALFWKKRWSGVTEAPRHVSIPSKEGLRRACEEAGFTQVSILPDSILACAGVWMLSLFPVLGRRDAGNVSIFIRLPIQFLSLILSLFVVPWCWIENHIICRPALVFVFAQKRAG